MHNSKKILNLTVTSVLLAIIVVMSFTPLGYLKVLAIEISLLSIPVAFGAAILGVKGGALLGLAFGVTSFIQCFGFSAFGTTLMGISPVSTFVVCIVPRVLLGIGSALVYSAAEKKNLNKRLASFLSFLAAAVINTILFVGMFMLLFSHTEFYAGLESSFEATNILSFFAAFVGINGIVEAVAGGVFGGLVGTVIEKLKKQMSLAK